MGINNDISLKPKKKAEEIKEADPIAEDTNKDPANKINEIPIDKSGLHKPVYEDIFHDHKDPFGHLVEKSDNLANTESDHQDFHDIFNKNNSENEVPRKKNHWFLYLFILAVLIFLSLLFYQNYDKVLNKFGIKSSNLSSDNTSSNKGVEVIDGQNYTSDVTSSTSTDKDSTTTDDTTPPSSDSSNTNPSTADTGTTTTPATTTIDKSTISIRVLNGNGIAGSAAQVKNKLVSAGYSIGNVTNASKFTYLKTTIYYNTGKETEAKQIAGELSDRQTELFENPAVAGQYNIIVVVGKN